MSYEESASQVLLTSEAAAAIISRIKIIPSNLRVPEKYYMHLIRQLVEMKTESTTKALRYYPNVVARRAQEKYAKNVTGLSF